LSSTYTPPHCWVPARHWRTAGLRYFSYKFFLEQQFGFRVQRVSVDGGFTCPNVDGRVAHGGCVFCDNRSFSPSRRLPLLPEPPRHVPRQRSVAQQLEEGIARLRKRYPDCAHYLAYFQPATNTYAPVDQLRALYEQALNHPQVIGLAIGTRPDCVPNEVLDLLTELATRTFVSVEYGMQTSHDRTLDWMNRGHHFDAMVDAVQRSRARGFEIGAHIMLGLPGESREDMQATARAAAALRLDAIKLHNLYVVERTRLADQVREGSVQLLDRDSYVDALIDTLERLPPDTVIQRLGGEAPQPYLIAPAWALDKSGLRLAIDQRLRYRDTWQSKRYDEAGVRRTSDTRYNASTS